MLSHHSFSCTDVFFLTVLHLTFHLLTKFSCHLLQPPQSRDLHCLFLGSWDVCASVMEQCRSSFLFFQVQASAPGFELPWWLSGKESACQYRRLRRHGFHPCIRKILWRRKWELTPVFLPGKFHGEKSLVGYSLWGCKELNMTEHTHSGRISRCSHVGIF